jgi:excisionase family DNA binding protein
VNEEKLTLAEAARELRMTTRALREACTAGRIGFVRVGHRHWLFTRRDIEEFLERNRFQPKTVYEKPKRRSTHEEKGNA